MKKFTLIFMLFLSIKSYSQTVPAPERERTYDVQHISMNISLDWEQKMVIGDVSTTIVPLSDGMTSFQVDAVAFDIESISVLEIPLRYEYDGKKITIFTPEPVNSTDTFGYTVKYTCKPQRGLYFRYPSELNPSMGYQVWTQGQSEDNKYWLPIYDYPNDKTTTEMYVTVDDKYVTLSNGFLESSYASAGIMGGTTWHWVQDKPHPTYLIMLGVGEWEIIQDEADGIEVLSYVDEDKLEMGEYAVRNTAEMMRFFNERFGYRYPWANYKQVIVKDFIYGGMENTTATVLNERVYYDPEIENDYGADGLISHELGHQWWGDLITCSNWSEIWLNESFATYSTSLWYEHYKGKDEFDYSILRNSDDAMKYDSTKKRLPIWAGYGSATENVYDKGSVAINSMRHVLGDSIFYLSLKTFLEDNEYKNVVTDDLSNSVDKVYNFRSDPTPGPLPTSHDWMFYQWIMKAGYPEFEVLYWYEENTKQLMLKIVQVQKQDTLTPSFKVPVDVRIYGQGHDLIKPIMISGTDITWTIDFPVEPEFVQFDYGNKIMDKTEYKDKSIDQTISQFDNSENAIDRIMAIRSEKENLSGINSKVNIRFHGEVIVIIEAVEKDFDMYKQFYNDEFWGTRKEAVDFYSFLADNPFMQYGDSEVRKTIYSFIKSKFDSEPNSRVKRAMLTALGKSIEKKDVDFIKSKIASTKNEYIISDGIKALEEALPKEDIYDAVIPYLFRQSHRSIITQTVVEVLDSADNGSPNEKIKDALISVAFGKDIESRTRTKALTALLDYAKDKEVKELAMRYADYNFRETEQAIIKLLGRSGDASLITYLRELDSRTTDPSINKSIADAIKELEK